MIGLTVTTNLELDPWTDLTPADLRHNPAGKTATIERVGLLPNGTESGRATVELLITLPSGERVIAETTLRLFRTMSAALLAAPVAELDEP